jgi:glutamyl/glutaminyl-tRNA synthetase
VIQVAYRVRFRPSCNGPLHLGSLYTAWQCWQIAKSRGGEFVLIADCTVPEGKWGRRMTKDERHDQVEEWLEDLNWLGLTPQLVVHSSDDRLRAAHHIACQQLRVPIQDGSEVPSLNRYVWGPWEGGTLTSYQPYLVVGRVTDDHELGISAFMRGADLLAEAQLYDWFAWQLYGYNYRVQQGYGPVLCGPEGEKFSKSAGCPWTVAALKADGYTPEGVLAGLSNLRKAPPQYGDAAQQYAVPGI